MGVMRMNLINLLLHTLLVIICIDNISTKENKSSEILWTLSGLCFSICIMLDIMKMM